MEFDRYLTEFRSNASRKIAIKLASEIGKEAERISAARGDGDEYSVISEIQDELNKILKNMMNKLSEPKRRSHQILKFKEY
jgi:hypothetical protein